MGGSFQFLSDGILPFHPVDGGMKQGEKAGEREKRATGGRRRRGGCSRRVAVRMQNGRTPLEDRIEL